MGSLWEISRNLDGSFDIARDRVVLHRNIPDRWLGDELVRYGLTGPEFGEIPHQLTISAVAILDYRSPPRRRFD
jgi:hypothetical protein